MVNRCRAAWEVTVGTKKTVKKAVPVSAIAPARENLRLFKMSPLPFGRVSAAVMSTLCAAVLNYL
jgi:hypothetical protein